MISEKIIKILLNKIFSSAAFFPTKVSNIYEEFSKCKDIMTHTHSEKLLLIKLPLYALHFDIAAVIFQAFLKSGYRFFVSQANQLSKQHFNFNVYLIIIVEVLPSRVFLLIKE